MTGPKIRYNERMNLKYVRKPVGNPNIGSLPVGTVVKFIGSGDVYILCEHRALMDRRGVKLPQYTIADLNSECTAYEILGNLEIS